MPVNLQIKRQITMKCGTSLTAIAFKDLLCSQIGSSIVYTYIHMGICGYMFKYTFK